MPKVKFKSNNLDNITRIAKNLINGTYPNNPVMCADDRAILSGEYAFICGQLEIILSRKPVIWNNMRSDPTIKSDTACERKYQQTEDGVNEMGLKLRLKSCEKMMNGLSGLLKIAEGQSKNLY